MSEKTLESLEEIKSIIENGEKRAEIGFKPDDVIDIIASLDDINYIRSVIQKSELRKKVGLGDYSELELMLLMANKKIIDEYVEKFKENQAFERILCLPEEMKIGIEIESIGRCARYLLFLQEFNDLKFEKDDSVEENGYKENGFEAKLPPLTGNNSQSTNAIKNAASILEAFGQYTNETCGGHIHVEAKYLKNICAWQNLLEIYGNLEELLYIISNEAGIIPREGIIKFASPLSRVLEESSVELSIIEDVEELKVLLMKKQETKHKGINFLHLEPQNIGTIEFRISNGSVNADVLIENINLFGGIVAAAQELSIIQEKNFEELTDEEKEKLQAFNKLRNGKLNPEEELDILLTIAIKQEDRHIYINRYNANAPIWEDFMETRKGRRLKFAQSPIVINKRTIGKKVFKGDCPVTGAEMAEMSSLIAAKGKNKEVLPENT